MMKFLFEYLKVNSYKLTTCESFTGGEFASEFTNQPGASDFFIGGFICYSNDFKINQLQIDEQIIEKHSAVSKIVLEEMLIKTNQKLGGEICFAFTGYAPPKDVKNPQSGLSYVGFMHKQEIFIFDFFPKYFLKREEYKSKAIDFVLKKFKKQYK